MQHGARSHQYVARELVWLMLPRVLALLAGACFTLSLWGILVRSVPHLGPPDARPCGPHASHANPVSERPSKLPWEPINATATADVVSRLAARMATLLSLQQQRVSAHAHTNPEAGPDVTRQAMLLRDASAPRNIHLLLQVYTSDAGARAAELDATLRANAANSALTSIHVFAERGSDVPDCVWNATSSQSSGASPLSQRLPTLVVVPTSGYVTFARMLAYAQRHLAHDWVVLANADVSTDASLAHLLRIPTPRSYFVTLSRFEADVGRKQQRQCSPSGYIGSHDAWAFVPPLANVDAVLQQTDFACGGKWGWGCENRLMYELEVHAGLTSVNPCSTIRIHHHHANGTLGRHLVNQNRLNTQGRSRTAVPCSVDDIEPLD